MKQSGIKDVMTKTKTVAAATTLLAGLGVATNVHADDVTENAQPQTQTPTETAEVTQSDVDTAKTALDSANEAVSTQEAQVQEAAKAADEAQATYDDAQKATNEAQELANQATPEAIQEVQSDVTEANAAISKAQDLQSQAENNQTTAESAVTNQEATVQTAKDQVAEAQGDVASAQKDVNDKQAILDGTGSQAVINEQAAAQADNETKEAAVKTAEANLTKAQQADKDRETAIQTAQSQVNSMTQAVNTTKADLDTKQDQASQATQALDKAKADYTKAENDYKSINTITMSAEYAKALKDRWDFNLTDAQRDVAYDTLRRLAEFEAAKNKFIHNENDKKQSFDINHVTAEQAQELSLFVAELINQARKAVGTPLVEVTVDSANEAQNHANYYATTDMTTFTFKHDMTDLDVKYTWVDEDWAGGLGFKQVSNLDEAKERIYQNALVGWIFNKNEWLHATSVVGTRNAVTGKSYIGIGFSKLKDGGDSINLNIFNTEYSNLSNFDTTPIANPCSSDKIITAYNTAKATLDTAQAKANTANQELATAQTAYDTAVTNFNKAQDSLTQANARPILTPTAQANLANAQTAYTKAQERLTKANQAVASLNADVKAKQANLATAKQTLTAKQAVLATKQNALAQEHAKLDSLLTNLATAKVQVSQAKANVDKAKVAYDTAKAHLAKLQNAPQALKEAQAKLAKAKTALLAKLDTLKASLVPLQELKAEQATAQTAYDKVSIAYQKVLEAQEKARLQEEYNTLVAQGKQPIPVVDETGKVTGYTVLTPEAPRSASEGQTTAQSVVTVTPTAVKASTPVTNAMTKASSNSLPMTGNSTSVLALFFGTVLTLFGLVGVRKKETK